MTAYVYRDPARAVRRRGRVQLRPLTPEQFHALGEPERRIRQQAWLQLVGMLGSVHTRRYHAASNRAALLDALGPYGRAGGAPA